MTSQKLNGVTLEQLEIEARDLSGNITRVTVWADAISWVYYVEGQTQASRGLVFQTAADLCGINAEQVAALIRAALLGSADMPCIWNNPEPTPARWTRL